MGRNIAGLALILCLGVRGACTNAPSPNIVWIVVDTLRADHTGFLGKTSTTPRLDALSEGSLVFTQAISQASWTKPSVATMFTSMNPRQHGVRKGLLRRGDVLPEELLTIAEVLQASGWTTLAVQMNPHLNSQMKFDQGFDVYQDRLPVRSDASTINSEVKQLLKILKGQTYFLYIHYMDVHLPYREHKEYSDMYGDHDTPLSGLFLRRIQKLSLTENDKEYLKALYDGEVRHVDEQIGELLEEFDENTVIIVSSDHGEEFWDHGGFEHGHSVYDELIRVPLLVKVPGYGHQRIDSQVRLLDIAPTILDVLGIDIPGQFMGKSLLEALRDPQDRDSWSESTLYGQPRLANRTGTEKVIFNIEDGTFEAYDLATDPLEQHPTDAGVELKGKLREFIAIEPRESQTELIDEQTREQLRSLGYIE